MKTPDQQILGTKADAGPQLGRSLDAHQLETVKAGEENETTRLEKANVMPSKGLTPRMVGTGGRTEQTAGLGKVLFAGISLAAIVGVGFLFVSGFFGVSDAAGLFAVGLSIGVPVLAILLFVAVAALFRRRE